MRQGFTRLVMYASVLLLSVGCATAIQKTQDLRPAMTMDEVRKVLGAPSEALFVTDRWVWKYYLTDRWRGSIPYYLVFDKDAKTLQAWFPDEEEFRRNQRATLDAFQALPPQFWDSLYGPPRQQLDLTIRRRP